MKSKSELAEENINSSKKIENDNQSQDSQNNADNIDNNSIPKSPNFSFNSGNSLTFRECFNYYLSYFYSKNFENKDYIEPQNANFFYRFFGNYPKIYALFNELKNERNFLLFLKDYYLSNNDNMYKVILSRVVQFITIENNENFLKYDITKVSSNNNSKNISVILTKSYELFKQKLYNCEECHTFIDEFDSEKIPAIMIIQLFFIFEKFPDFISAFVQNFFVNEKEIIIMFSFYLTWIAVDRLKSGRLNLYFNKNKNVLDTFNEFFLGLFNLTYNILEKSQKLNTCFLKKVRNEANNLPSSILWGVKNFKHKFPEMKTTESSLSSYFNNSNINI